MLRPIITSTVLGAVVGSVLAGGVLFARAEGTPNTVTIDNFSFTPAAVTVYCYPVKSPFAMIWTVVSGMRDRTSNGPVKSI